MSEHLDRALAILEVYNAETIERMTTCAGCVKKMNPEIVVMSDGTEGVAIAPLCEDCKRKELLWHETHCENCGKELPRFEMEYGDVRFCGSDCTEEYTGSSALPEAEA